MTHQIKDPAGVGQARSAGGLRAEAAVSVAHERSLPIHWRGAREAWPQTGEITAVRDGERIRF
jgi:hypothetical protein